MNTEANYMQPSAELLAFIEECRQLIPQAKNGILQKTEEELLNEANIACALSLSEHCEVAVPFVGVAKSTAIESNTQNTYESGTGTQDDPYIIATTEHFLALANATNPLTYYSLSASINLLDVELSPMGTLASPLSGHFLGNDFEILNANIPQASDYAGIFGYVVDAEFTDFIIKNAYVKGAWSTGTFIGHGERCTLNNISLLAYTTQGTALTGGITGKMLNTSITNCHSNGNVSSIGVYTGGICAYVQDGTVDNCEFSGTVVGINYVGGILGGTTANVYSCVNNGIVRGNLYVGGIAGVLLYANILRVLIKCANTGDITGLDMIGGIAGYAASYNVYNTGVNFLNVANTGTILANGSFAGGIIGNAECLITVQAAYNMGDVSANVSACGGIFGRLNTVNSWMGIMANCYNKGKIKKGTHAGSLIGYSSALGVRVCLYLSEQKPAYCTNDVGYNNKAPSGIFTNVLSATVANLKTSVSFLAENYFANDINNLNDSYPILFNINYTMLSHGTYFSYASSFKAAAVAEDQQPLAQDFSSKYYYNDNYFEQSAYTYNSHLATMSLSLAMSAFGSNTSFTADVPPVQDYSTKSKNAIALLNNLGFNPVYANVSFTIPPTTDSIGCVVGSKLINVNSVSSTLIAVAIRGGGYGYEWASNFTIGEEGFHQGFAEARDQIIAFLQEYVVANTISGNVKIWITGYSRAAATANLVAGALDNGIELVNCTYTPENVYAYTFETPRGVLKDDSNDDIYKNIFNIVNDNDLVTKVAPLEWSFNCYGVSKLIPTRLKAPTVYQGFLSKMLPHFISICGGEHLENGYMVDTFMANQINWGVLAPDGITLIPYEIVPDTITSLETFLDNFIGIIAENIFENRNNYTTEYQAAFRAFFMPLSSGAESNFSLSFLENLTQYIIEIMLFIGFFPDEPSTEESFNAAYNFLEEQVLAFYADKNYSTADAVTLSQNLWHIIKNLLKSYPNETYTVFQSLTCITQSHYPEVCLAWMKAMDTYFTAGEIVPFIEPAPVTE